MTIIYRKKDDKEESVLRGVSKIHNQLGGQLLCVQPTKGHNTILSISQITDIIED